MSLAIAPDQMTPTAPEPKPRRSRKTARSVDQATRSTAKRTPMSEDPGKTKIGVYLSNDTAKLLKIVATIQDKDQSEIVEHVLSKYMPSVNGALWKLMDRGKSDDQAITVEGSADA